MERDDPAFWQACDALVRGSAITIDRPRGAPHPRRPELIYRLDYGYLVGTTAGDGSGIDVWLGGGAGKTVTAVARTVDPFKRDAELKLLLGCAAEGIATVSVPERDSRLAMPHLEARLAAGAADRMSR